MISSLAEVDGQFDAVARTSSARLGALLYLQEVSSYLENILEMYTCYSYSKDR